MAWQESADTKIDSGLTNEEDRGRVMEVSKGNRQENPNLVLRDVVSTDWNRIYSCSIQCDQLFNWRVDQGVPGVEHFQAQLEAETFRRHIAESSSGPVGYISFSAYEHPSRSIELKVVPLAQRCSLG